MKDSAQGRGGQVAAVVAHRSVFAGGVAPEVIRRLYEPLGRFLGWQPVAGWERLEGADFASTAEHSAVVGIVPFELPPLLRAFLFSGLGPVPTEWGPASTPTCTAEMWLRWVVEGDTRAASISSSGGTTRVHGHEKVGQAVKAVRPPPFRLRV